MKRAASSITKQDTHVDCPDCGKTMRKNNLKKHLGSRFCNSNPSNVHNKHAKVSCGNCGIAISSNKLAQHMLTHNANKPCPYCKKEFRSDKLAKHALLCQYKIGETLCDRKSGVKEKLEHDVDCISVSGYFQCFKLDIPDSIDYDQIINDSCQSARSRLLQILQLYPIKAQIVLVLTFYKEVEGRRYSSKVLFFSVHSFSHVLVD